MWVCHHGAWRGMIIVAFPTASAQPHIRDQLLLAVQLLRDNKPNTREPKVNELLFIVIQCTQVGRLKALKPVYCHHWSGYSNDQI